MTAGTTPAGLGGGLAGAPREDEITIMTDHLAQAAGTVRGVLDDLASLPVTAGRAKCTAAILDRLAAELGEAAALLRGVPDSPPVRHAEHGPGDR